ncbi:MAG: NAD(P)H-hydrate dehydratase [Verrucomicrobia bacterium]|nr:NAD(P)H-hydrate dehydratase [Verrucomicrobiota bacterium]MBU1734803.1 NAD(P)H-hydrate dehydratase [Verrucomicrobiota bacterium]MBU1858020.1 NAD(P)H-hydrate dehydratase [Verrucomicrobiota bacterium]
MKIISTAVMRELDRKTIADFEVPGETLMDRAGFGVARFVDYLFQTKDFYSRSVRLVAGRGNNGGDIFAAARYLRQMDYDVDILLAGSLADVRGDALTHLGKLKSKRIPVDELPTPKDWEEAIALTHCARSTDAPVIVDGVLGTGIQGPARGLASGAIRFINAHAGLSLVVAVDVPSGLDSDTGRAEGDAVMADYTLTMGLPKQGLVEPCAADHVGRLEVIRIGIPDDLIDKVESDLELITPSDLHSLFSRRTRTAHKGTFGHLLIVGGAAGFSGAIALAARAALRSGVGLVTVVVPRAILPIVAGLVPEAMVHGVAETDIGSLASGMWPVWRERLDTFSAILAGPGMTRHAETTALIRMILADTKVPLALDADALNVFAGQMDELTKRTCPLVITPHPGEMACLLGRTAAEVQANRFEVAKEAAKRARAVTILKGAGTLVAEAGQPLAINMTGNPGMATGGMGDVLAGLLGGLLAQGLKPFDAARAAVFLHGQAGDQAADEKSEPGIIAGDLIEELPYAFQDIIPR